MANEKEIRKRVNKAPFEEVIRRAVPALRNPADDKGEPLSEGTVESAPFKRKEVRRIFHGNEWYFSVIDVVAALSSTTRPRQYWSDLKSQLSHNEGFSELYGKIVQLKMPSPDGKLRETDTVNVETLLRIVQSIPSPNAEPFKKWLARVGYERIQEFHNPEVSVRRAMLNWKIQGRTEEWIEDRVRSIVVRHELTSEWARRGVTEGAEYGYLTNVISKETFGLKTEDHKQLKSLKSQNLRDHMTDLELIFTILGEKSTVAIAQATNVYGLHENERAATSGGRVAGDARRQLERETGQRVVSPSNFLPKREDKKRLSSKSQTHPQ